LTRLSLRANLRCLLRVTHLLLHANLRSVARAHVANLVDAWGHCDTNIRRTFIKCISYMIDPLTFLIVGYILKLARIWQLHCILYKPHLTGDIWITHIHKQSHRWITYSYIFINQILHKVYHFEQINHNNHIATQSNTNPVNQILHKVYHFDQINRINHIATESNTNPVNQILPKVYHVHRPLLE
jgi:hypothetical protein